MNAKPTTQSIQTYRLAQRTLHQRPVKPGSPADRRAKLLELLREWEDEATLAELVELSGRPKWDVANHLVHLEADGSVLRVGHGRYAAKQ